MVLKGIPMVFKCVFPYSVVMAGSVNGKTMILNGQ